MSILDQLKTRESYMDKFPKGSRSTISNEKAALNSFDKFCGWKFRVSAESVIRELAKFDEKKQKSTTFSMLQTYSNYLVEEQQIAIGTAKQYSKSVKNYINYMLELEISNEQFRREIKFSRQEIRDDYPLSPEEAMALLAEARSRKLMYLFQMGTGIAIGECMHLRKRDLDCSLERIRIKVPAKYRKVKSPKVTFVPKWIESEMKELLDSLKDDDYLFNIIGNPNTKNAVISQEQFFDRVRKRAKLDDLVYDSGTHKITIHVFRSWFITHADRIDFGLGHALAGHGYYMKKYNRYTEKELLEFFIKAESLLSPYEVQNTEEQKERRVKFTELENKFKEDTMKIESEKNERISQLEKEVSEIRKGLQKRIVVNFEDPINSSNYRIPNGSYYFPVHLSTNYSSSFKSHNHFQFLEAKEVQEVKVITRKSKEVKGNLEVL